MIFFHDEKPIDYEIIDGVCSYCGKNAEYGQDSMGVMYSFCEGCDNYNNDLEMWQDDDDEINNLNVYF